MVLIPNINYKVYIQQAQASMNIDMNGERVHIDKPSSRSVSDSLNASF